MNLVVSADACSADNLRSYTAIWQVHNSYGFTESVSAVAYDACVRPSLNATVNAAVIAILAADLNSDLRIDRRWGTRRASLN